MQFPEITIQGGGGGVMQFPEIIIQVVMQFPEITVQGIMQFPEITVQGIMQFPEKKTLLSLVHNAGLSRTSCYHFVLEFIESLERGFVITWRFYF